MIDILYLAHGREEFTRKSLSALAHNTEMERVSRIALFTDGAAFPFGRLGSQFAKSYGGPVAVLNAFLTLRGGSEIFAKIDNDVIVPLGWLESALAVMGAHPELDILGLEPPASRTANPSRRGEASAYPSLVSAAPEIRGPFGTERCRLPFLPRPIPHDGGCYAPTEYVGGVFVARRSAFEGRALPIPYANGRGGFGDWQLANKDLVKGWIVPPLKLFLLDRLPFEPWLSLSKKYIAEGIQRPWTNYPMEAAADLWQWWAE